MCYQGVFRSISWDPGRQPLSYEMLYAVLNLRKGDTVKNVDWSDPDVVSLHERLAVCIRQQYELELATTSGQVDPAAFAARVATEIMGCTLHVDVAGSSGEWSLVFAADVPPSQTRIAGCTVCAASQGDLHRAHCRRSGIVRPSGFEVRL